MCTSNPNQIAPLPPSHVAEPRLTSGSSQNIWGMIAICKTNQERKDITTASCWLGLSVAREAREGCSKRIGLWEAPAGWGQVCPDTSCSHLMICLLVKYHLERGKSGPAVALLSINHSAASTSQPSILDSEDSNYFNCATRREKHVCGIVVSAEEANSDRDLRG